MNSRSAKLTARNVHLVELRIDSNFVGEGDSLACREEAFIFRGFSAVRHWSRADEWCVSIVDARCGDGPRHRRIRRRRDQRTDQQAVQHRSDRVVQTRIGRLSAVDRRLPEEQQNHSIQEL